jgi:hypothetical protein
MEIHIQMTAAFLATGSDARVRASQTIQCEFHGSVLKVEDSLEHYASGRVCRSMASS